MRLEALLGAAVAAAVVVVVALTALVPGFVSAPPPEPDEPSARLDVAEMTLQAGDATMETATLETTAYLRHGGGPADDVTVVARATDRESGLVADTTTREVGRIEGEGERQVPVSVTVPREGGYEMTTLLYVDGRRVDAATATVSGVGALTPPAADSSVRFRGFARRPAVEYTIESVEDGRATLNVSTYLTNSGDDPEPGLRLVVTARQADSSVVADRSEREVGRIGGGRTATPNVRVTVPDGYGYYLDVALWRDGVLLESTRAPADLDPEETVSVDETRQEIDFRASDFETGGGGAGERQESSAAESAGDGPGFGPVVAAVALVAALLATRRRSA